MLGHDSEFGLSKGGVIHSALSSLDSGEVPEGRWFPDNLNAEIAISPVNTLKEWHHNTVVLLDKVRSQGFDLVMRPVIKYNDRDLSHPQALISGCNPDYNAYAGGVENEPPSFKTMDGIRSCGAHVHVGEESIDPGRMSRWMDIYLGLPLLLKEERNTRRQLYGAAGCYRPKPYGTEYRTLSNVWLDSQTLREFVWEGTHRALEAARKGDIDQVEQWQDVVDSINNHDTVLAQQTIDRLYAWGVTSV